MADVGFGTTITFASGFCAEVRSASHSGHSRTAVETTHMTSTEGWKTFMPSDLKNPGTATIVLEMNPNAGTGGPPITGAAETITITFPVPSGGNTGASLACSGFLTESPFELALEDVMTMTLTVQFTGKPTWTDST